MRFSILRIERERFQRRVSGLRISLERRNINVSQEVPDFGNSRPRAAKSGILLQSACEEVERPTQILFAASVREVKTLQIKIVGLRVALFVKWKRNRQLDFQRI